MYQLLPSSIPKYLIDSKGILHNSSTGKQLKSYTNNHGYEQVRVSPNGRKGKKITLRNHREVALAFIPNPLNLKEVNHKDLNKQNNSVHNLEWVDRKTNIAHAFSAGAFTERDELHSKATKEQQLEAVTLYTQGTPVKELATIYGASPNTVYAWFNKLISPQERLRLKKINISKGKTKICSHI